MKLYILFMFNETHKVKIYFGDHNKNEWEDGEFFLEADQILIHENYNSYSMNHDVCLLHTESDIITMSKISGGPDVQIACLPNGPTKHGKACWVGGWGATEWAGSSSNVLMSVGVNTFSDDYCRKHRKS